jgi:hypothetical protein
MNVAIPNIIKARTMRVASPIPTIIPVDIVVMSIILFVSPFAGCRRRSFLKLYTKAACGARRSDGIVVKVG